MINTLIAFIRFHYFNMRVFIIPLYVLINTLILTFGYINLNYIQIIKIYGYPIYV